MILASDVKRELKERLTAAGLWDKLDLRESQFLELAPQVFVELVLFDAAAMNAVADVANDVQLAHPQDDIDVLIRAHWQVRNPSYAGHAFDLSGGVEGAERFEVVIESGDVTGKVTVDVSKDAIEVLASRLQPVEPDPVRHRKVVSDLVKRFVELQLSQGGTSYWDPVRFPRLELNAADMRHLMERELVKIDD